MTNQPRQGTCSYCDCQSARLLDPPLIEIQLTDLKILPEDNLQPGDHVFWTPNSVPASRYEIVELRGDSAICLAPETSKDKSYCYLCFAGHLWPSLRPYTINMPPNLHFSKDNPWHNPVWVTEPNDLV